MTTKQFSEAWKIAQSDEDLSQIDDSILYGCGLEAFKTVTTTIKTVAKLLRWQCVCIFDKDKFDAQELDNMAHIARRKFRIA